MPLEDAHVVKLLQAKGALVLAKTVCGEFAFFAAFCLSRQVLLMLVPHARASVAFLPSVAVHSQG